MTTSSNDNLISEVVKQLVEKQQDLLRPMIQNSLQEMLEAQMDETIGAGKSKRSGSRLGYRSGYYPRTLLTRVGRISLRVPRDRDGLFSTTIFEKYQRSEKALVLAIAQMYVQGVSTRKVKAIAEELFDEQISASTVSRLTKSLDESLSIFANAKIDEQYPYLILDARYEKVRESGTVNSKAILVAIGVSKEGKRAVLGIELANRESECSWYEFISKLQDRGLSGVQLVISDAHKGLQAGIEQLLTNATWQRCYVHFLRNALGYLPKSADKECLLELRQIFDRFSLEEARTSLSNWIQKWENKYQKVVDFVEENIDQCLNYYGYPPNHRIYIRSSNSLERFNQEIKRRTQVIRIFPNEASALRLIRAIGIETHERWITQQRYLNMDELEEFEELKEEKEEEISNEDSNKDLANVA